jgi:hypothetical protein
MNSTDWLAKFKAAKGTDAPAMIRGIGVYEKCYDARTDQLAARLGRAGKGPLMGARGDFLSLDKAVKEFAAKALADSQPPADAVKSAYAALYEKQFRYEFYQGYEPKPAPAAAAPATKPPNSAPAVGRGKGPVDASGAAQGVKKPDVRADSSRDASMKPDASADPNANDADPVTLAKNHFGALLGALPDEQMHQLHAAFGEILGPNAASSHMQLLVYRYAIFLMEPAEGEPFSPPPF